MELLTPAGLGHTHVSATTVELSWNVREEKLKADHYNIRYQREGETKWKNIDTDTDINSYRITDLQSDTKYLFKVRTVIENGDESLFSKPCAAKTASSPSEQFKQPQSKLDSKTSLNVYQVPIIKEFVINQKMKTRKISLFKEQPNKSKLDKTIMVLGATGAGKSTLIDGMANYMLDIAWEDDSRFKIIKLTTEELKKQNESESQTEWITSYTLPWMPGCRVDFNVNIIDTPGFGDCRGIERDKEIVDQIRSFFEASGNEQGIEVLDAVWFVVQAPMCRLTPTQNYIFDSILAIFGNDIKDSIFVLITFADGPSPPVLVALTEIDFPSNCKVTFNNSALFLDPTNAKNGHFFWKMGLMGYEEVFKKLTSSKSSNSLCLTRDVLQNRKLIEDNITRIQSKIERGTEKQAEMQEEERILQKHERDIADNKDFEYTINEEQVVHEKLPQGKHTTTCTKCNFTCHEDCIYANDKDKAQCSSMRNGYCTKCEKRCKWDLHYNYPYIIKRKKMESKKTYSEMKKKYMDAAVEKEKAVTLLETIRIEYDKIMNENDKLVEEVKECLNRLQEIALKPNPISEIQYIDILITNEEEGRKEGYKDRIKTLKTLRKKAEIRAKIKDDKSLTQ